MKTRFLLLFLMLSVAAQGARAELPRRAFLGTQLYTVNDSIARQYELPEVRGALIGAVVEGSSARAAGLKAGDIIISVSGEPVFRHEDVLSLIGRLRAGDEAVIGFYRDGELHIYNAVLTALPKESSEHARVIYDAVPWAGGYVRTIIHRPDEPGKHPALFFIQGASCGSVDRMNPRDPVARFLDSMSRLGYVVIKTEKAGVGDSRNDIDCKSCDLLQEVDLFSASYNNLANYDFIDHERVFVFGHSMGGVQAPLLDAAFPPRGIAVFGTVVRPWFEYFIDITRMQRLLLGQDYLENEDLFPSALQFFYSLMVEKKSPEELLQNEKARKFMLNYWSYDGAENFHGRHYTFWQQLQDVRLFKAWAETPAHVLSIWGEGEFVAVNPYEHQLIADIVNHYNPGKARFIRMPEINHGFVRVNDLQHAISVRNDWEYQYSHFNEELPALIHEWIQELSK